MEVHDAIRAREPTAPSERTAGLVIQLPSTQLPSSQLSSIQLPTHLPRLVPSVTYSKALAPQPDTRHVRATSSSTALHGEHMHHVVRDELLGISSSSHSQIRAASSSGALRRMRAHDDSDVEPSPTGSCLPPTNLPSGEPCDDDAHRGRLRSPHLLRPQHASAPVGGRIAGMPARALKWLGGGGSAAPERSASEIGGSSWLGGGGLIARALPSRGGKVTANEGAGAWGTGKSRERKSPSRADKNAPGTLPPIRAR